MKLIHVLLCFALFGVDHRAMAQYCTDSASINGDYYDIKLVKITEAGNFVMSNSSGCGVTGNPWTSFNGRYSDYTTQNIFLRRGKTHRFVIKIESCTTLISGTFQHVFLGIDTFGKGNITYIHNPGFIGGPIGDSFVFDYTAPTNTTLGNTRMRIRLNMNCHLESNCAIYSNGETEDYTVHFCSPLTYQIETQNPLCHGESNGYNRIYAIGGTAPLQYRWDNGAYQSTAINNTLASGWHFYYIKDADNCIYRDSFYLGDEDKLTATYQVDSSCKNDSIGRIKVLADGGVGSFSYRIDTFPYQGSNVFEYLPKGIYKVRVRDANNCILDSNIDIAEKDYPKIQYSFSIDSIRCNNSKDGKISISTSNAIKPYWFSMDKSSNKPDSFFTNIDSGLHKLRITDAKGCFKEFSIYLANPLPVKPILIDKRNLTCRGDSNGWIHVLATGGKTYLQPYNFQWASGFSGNIITQLKYGDYRVYVKDQNQCIDSLDVAIRYLYDSLYLSHTLTNPVRCFSDSNAIISLMGNKGLSPYRYSLNGSVFSTQSIYPKLGYGVYLVQVKDSVGCISSANIINTFIDTPLSVDLEIDTNICYNATTVNVLFKPLNGSSPYNIQIDQQPPTSDFSSKNISTNRWVRYQVADNNNCKIIDSLRISTPAKPRINYTLTHNKCYYDSLGQIAINSVQGKYPPFEHSINNATYSSNSTYDKLASTTYILYTRDSIKCISTDTVTIYTNSKFKHKTIIQPPLCSYDTNGKIQIYSYNSQTPPMISFQGDNYSYQTVWSGLPRGFYNYKIKYDSLCILDTTVWVGSFDTLKSTYIIDSIRCYGMNNAKIRVNTSGGKFPYSYFINRKPTTNIIEGLSPNVTYSLKTMDINGCKDSVDINLPEPSPVFFTQIDKKDISCYGAKDGSISFNIKGGITPYQYYLNSRNIISDTIHSLPSDMYKIEVRDYNNCIISKEIFIDEPNRLTLTIDSLIENKCWGQNQAGFTLRAIGGTYPYHFIWNTGDTFYKKYGLASDIEYKIKLYDAHNCIDSFKYQFKAFSKLNPKLWARDATCPYALDGGLRVVIDGGNPFYENKYIVKINNEVYKGNNILYKLGKGNYPIHIIDSHSCIIDTSVQILSPLKPIVELDTLYVLEEMGKTIALEPVLLSGNVNNSLWLPSIGLSCADCFTTTFNGYATQQYHLILTYNKELCTDTLYTKVIVPSILHDLYIPNSFSPNAVESANREFRAYGNKILKFEMQIYNRWGEKVFETYQLENAWNGKYKDEYQPVGVYLYTATIQFLDGFRLVKSGNVNLLW